MADDLGGYAYADERLNDILVTSVPQSLDEALAYGTTVNVLFPNHTLAYIKHRPPNEGQHKMLPYKWDGTKFIDIAEALS